MEEKTPKKKHNKNYIYKLYDSLTEDERKRFLKRFGLFHALFLDPDFEAKLRNINKLIRYNVDDSFTKKMLFNLERVVRNEKRVTVVDSDALFDRTISTNGELYDVVDRNDNFLLLVKADTPKEEVIKNLKERKENGYCSNDLFEIDWRLIKAVIPKLLDEYRRKTKHVPENMSPEEWDTILRDIIWLCNEYVQEFKHKGSHNYDERLAQAKKSFVEHFMDLL